MGTDIHMFLEKRNMGNGRWEAFEIPLSCHTALHEYPKEPCEKCNPPRWLLGWKERNYALFSILANVRNYDDDKLTPIGEMRDCPPDSLAASRCRVPGAYAEDFYLPPLGAKMWLGDHSHTWVSLSELNVYPWDGAMYAGMPLVFRVGCFRSCFLPALNEYARRYELAFNNIRLVMGFDS